MNLYLIGYRCSGKTTLGRILADMLGWDFEDMDDRFVAEQGISISSFVRLNGWEVFRTLERALLGRISRQQGQVVGTGGGVVLDPFNIDTMRNSGKVIWLRTRPETVLRLIRADAH